MRIRKRSVPLPLSSLCPITLPDRELYKLPSEQHQHGNKALRDAPVRGEEKEAKGLHPVADEDPSIKKVNTQLDQAQSSPNQPPTSPKLVDNRPFPDLQLLITRTRDGGYRGEQKTNTLTQGDKDLEGEEEIEGKRWRAKSNNFRKASSCVGEDADRVGLFSSADGLGLFSSSSNHVGSWCEGEKAFPLKKRRGSFKRKEGEETIIDKEKKMKTILRTQTSKKWVEEEGKEGIDSSNSVKKRGSRGVVMEGSRCSRVNGRGWRCRQQTLVGYSLCEHHLGKGRLRSMSSVRKRTSAIARPKKEETEERRPWSLSSSTSPLSSPFQEMQTLLDEDEEEGNPLMITKKRKKIGVVKARSISSLLGQTNNAIGTAESNSNSIL